MRRIFDTKVQHLKYKVLREVARMAWADNLNDDSSGYPGHNSSGKDPDNALLRI